jgi:hypothetical protein
VRIVTSLILLDDFLMHGVVLQNRVFQPRAAIYAKMFHVKHRNAPDASVRRFSPAPRIHRRAAMFHVKHFCVNPAARRRFRPIGESAPVESLERLDAALRGVAGSGARIRAS